MVEAFRALLGPLWRPFGALSGPRWGSRGPLVARPSRRPSIKKEGGADYSRSHNKHPPVPSRQTARSDPPTHAAAAHARTPIPPRPPRDSPFPPPHAYYEIWSTLHFLISVGGTPPTGVNFASSAHRDGGWSAFGARWSSATGVDLGLSAGVAPPRRLSRNSEYTYSHTLLSEGVELRGD